MKKPQIESIRVRAIVDENPDISWIGEYTDKAMPWHICRRCGQFLHTAEMYDRIVADIEDVMYEFGNALDYEDLTEETEKRYSTIYNAMQTAIDRLSDRRHECDTNRYYREYNYFKPYAGGEEPGTKEYQASGMQDYDRAEALNNGQWHFIGIKASAIVSYTDGNGKRLETFESGGLWGIESDAPDCHKKEVNRIP